MNKTVAMRAIGDLLVLAHTDKNPSNDEWQAFLSEIRRITPQRVRVLVRTEGAAPDSLQRQQFNDLLAGTPVPLAVLSDSRIVQGVGTALRWFNPMMRVLPSRDLAGALAHVKVSSSEHDAVLKALRELHDEVYPASAASGR